MDREILLLASLIIILIVAASAAYYIQSLSSKPGETTTMGSETQTSSTTTTQTTASTNTHYMTVVDDLNRTVRIRVNPSRIVTTMRIVSSFILQFDVKDKLVGVDSAITDNPFYLKCCPWLKNITVVATGKRNINLEQILALNPDVVFAKSYQRNLLMSIEDKVPIVYLDLETPKVFMHDLDLVGRILGQSERAEYLKNYYTSLLKTVENRTSHLSPDEKPLTLFIYYAGEHRYNVPPKHWLQYYMIQLAGGKTPEIEGIGWVEVNVEQIIEWKPEIIFIVQYRGDSVKAAEEILNDPLLSSIPAVANHKVYPIPSDGEPWDMPTPKWILCTVYMAKMIHPELFKDINLVDLTIEFYMNVYGMSRSDAESLVPSIIRAG